jgi:hypothetical protein
MSHDGAASLAVVVLPIAVREMIRRIVHFIREAIFLLLANALTVYLIVWLILNVREIDWFLLLVFAIPFVIAAILAWRVPMRQCRCPGCKQLTSGDVCRRHYTSSNWPKEHWRLFVTGGGSRED